MMKILPLQIAILFMVSTLGVSAQAPIRKLPQSINRPTINVEAPFISLDGSTLLFTSDYSEDNVPTAYYTQKEGIDWKEPAALPKHINTRLNYLKGYTLSADGKTIYITSIKSGGVGGYDIWAGSLKGTSWGDLQNMYAPINSKLHEGAPTFTPDGNTMYFMRCERMDQQKAEKCKVMVTKKNTTGRWEEPQELPSNINTGNSQTPRISADGTTLIFSSNLLQPNKGGMDLYLSKFRNGAWGDPVALDFINTEKDDQFVSSISNGRYLLKDAPGKFKREILEYLVPKELQPRAVMKVEGQITDANGKTTPAYISVTDLSNHSRFFSGRPDVNGNFFLYLTQGTSYELSIDPEESHFTFYSKMLDMRGEENPLVQKVQVVLKPIAIGDELELDGLQFKPYSADLDEAGFELRRITRLIRSTPQFKFELQVLLLGYQEDSIRSNPDLTEISIDSVIVQLDSIDTLGQLFTFDSLIVKTTYHNNRTIQQALNILTQLEALGTDPNSLSYFVNARQEAILENRRTIVRLAVRKKD